MSVESSSLSARLKDLITKSGRSERDVSLAAGLNPGAVNDLINKPDRSPQLKTLQAIADVIGVSVHYLIDGTRGNGPAGFAESEAAAWSPKPSGERADLADQTRRLPQTLAPLARQPAAYRINAAIPGFGMLSDDVAIVDLNRRARDGDIVVATVIDLATGSGRTVIRRLLSPYLVSGDPDDHETTLIADGTRTAIMGVIVASFRAPQIV